MNERQELESVADYLEKKQGTILNEWKRKVKESDSKSSRLITLSREKFVDHIPVFLNNLIRHFRGETGEKSEAGKEHGEQRWEFGIDLRQLTKEWSMLHEVLIEQLGICFVQYSFDQNIIQHLQKIVAQNIHRGIKDSVDKFYSLEKRKAEAQFRDLSEVLQKREKEVKSHSKDLQQTSHDIKGNLLSLRIAVSLLKDRNLQDEKAVEIIEEMDLATDGLNQLLNELLDLFRLEAGHTEIEVTSFDAAKELQNFCKSMKPMADKEGLELRYSGEGTLPVKGDRQKVRRIVQNLLLNALKYTESGYVEVNWKKQDKNQWLLKISDSGPGLSYTHAASMSTKSDSVKSSDSFSSDITHSGQNRSKAEKHGEGIGLLIVRELCQIMNAVIKVDTAPGEGTTFHIILPVDISKENSS